MLWATATIAYLLLKHGGPFRELGGHYFDQRDRDALKRHLVRRLERLGHTVVLDPEAA